MSMSMATATATATPMAMAMAMHMAMLCLCSFAEACILSLKKTQKRNIIILNLRRQSKGPLFLLSLSKERVLNTQGTHLTASLHAEAPSFSNYKSEISV